jgi:phage N-6-adenine-methyltransferase
VRNSRSQEWGTPRHIFDPLHAEFQFQRDVAASRENHILPTYWTADDDALRQDWPGVVWCNPPYSSNLIGRFVEKAWRESQNGSTCVLLVPVRADLGWWHDYALRGEIRFIRGRVKFAGMKTTAPFACCVIVFRPPVAEATP